MRIIRAGAAACLVAIVVAMFPLGPPAVSSELLVPEAADPSVHQQRLAFAEWTGKRLSRDSWRWIGALIWESDPATDDPFRFGGVFKGICHRKRGDGGTSIRCAGRGRGLSPKDVFTMDPVAGSAVLDARDRTGHHHVEWTALNKGPGMYQSQSSCSAGQGVGAGIVRDAVAGGHVYGRDRYSSPSFTHWNMLWSGAAVTQCRFLSASEIQDLRDGGSFHLTTRH